MSDAWKRFSELPIWEDGLSEMSYYDATCTIYGEPRSYTRVHLLNRQFMDSIRYIKTTEDTANAVPAFKFTIAEEVPTENYNYRYLFTTFLERPSLRPIKVSASSQEWCGHTFKYLTWERRKEFAPKDWSLDICCYSYFEDEGDRWFPHPGDAHIDAYESLFVFARAVMGAGGEERRMKLLRPLRSNRQPDPEPYDAVLKPVSPARMVSVPLGTINARRIAVEWSQEPTWFEVESNPPYRILSFQAADVQAQLRFVERRAYWRRDKPSRFYTPGKAP